MNRVPHQGTAVVQPVRTAGDDATRPVPAVPVPRQRGRDESAVDPVVSARFAVLDDVGVITVTGVLGTSAVEPLRTALDVALEQGLQRVVLDLRGTADPVPATVPLLGATRRYLRRRGVALTLVALPVRTRQRLHQAHVETFYDLRTSLDQR